jgi:hypothetical protein
VSSAQDDAGDASDSDGVLVLSVWRQGPDGFLGRLTATRPGGEEPSVTVVSSPEELLEAVRTWLATTL